MRAKGIGYGLTFAAATALAILPSHAAETGVTPGTILIGQSAATSGPLAELGVDAVKGAKAYFDMVNARGGVNGRQIKLVTLDDGYVVPRSVENVKRLVNNDGVFALFNCMGTPNNDAIMPIITQAGVPHVAPFTGADNVRTPVNRYVFNIRAGYGDETEKMVEHLLTVGIDRIAVVYQNNSFGKAGLEGIEKAMQRRGKKIVASTTVENDASDARKAAQNLAKVNVQSIVVITAGKPSIDFIKQYRLTGQAAPLYALSVMGSASAVKALGADGVGLAVAQVMPYPWSTATPIVNEYQKAMAAAGHTDFSFVSLEGYVNAKVLVEALKRSGREPTRESFVAALETMGDVDLGGYSIGFARDKRQGSRFVELTMIGSKGRFIR